MSNYIKQTKNPKTGKWEDAHWMDDHFGKHHYGVSFPSGDEIWDPEEVKLETRDNDENLNKEEKCNKNCCNGECNHDACCGKITENCKIACPCHFPKKEGEFMDNSTRCLKCNSLKDNTWEEEFDRKFVRDDGLMDKYYYDKFMATYIKQFISSLLYSTLASYRKELVEVAGKSHDLETMYTYADCGLTDHCPVWDGNYYTCKFCGKEFVIKQAILSIISKGKEE